MSNQIRSFFTTVIFCFAGFFSVQSQTKVIPLQQLQSSGLYFGASMNTSAITVTFTGPSDRWVGFGFGTFMNLADAFIYTVGNPSSLHPLGWKDYFNSSSGTTLDNTQNWTVTSTATTSTQQTVVATRALNTSDPSDVAISFSSSALNLIWARSSTANYTLANHGTSNRGYGISLTWLSAPTASFTANTTTICQGSSVSFNNLSTGGSNSYTWNFSGASTVSSTATSPNISFTTAGTFSVSLTASNSIGSDTFTQVNFITVNPTITPAVSISQTGGGNPICFNGTATFSASPVNGGNSPSYQWKINGAISGGNSPTFTATSLPNPASITCVMTSNTVCPVPSGATSSAIVLTVNSSAPATVSVSINNGANPICNGGLVSFTATPGNGGGSPSYQWLVNSSNVGGNSPTFTSNTLANNSTVSCIVVSSNTCASVSSATSGGITMTVTSVLFPTLSVSQTAGGNPACAGYPVSFSATVLSGGGSPTIQWKVNGVNTGTNNPVFTSTTLANNSTVTCQMTSNASCASPSVLTSSAFVLTVNPTPSAPVITPTGQIVICQGDSVLLVSSIANNINWSNGATTQSVYVSAAGGYSVTQTVGGCTSFPSAATTLSVNALPGVTLTPFGPMICVNDDTIALNGIPAGGTYSGTGVIGSVFDPALSGPGNYIVSYKVTDANNCKNSANLQVTVSACTGISEGDSRNTIRVSPNPFNNRLTINSDNDVMTTVRIIDLSGRMVEQIATGGVKQLVLESQSLSSGIYFIEAETSGGTFRLKVIKE